jgi:hypothetical protein
MTCAHVVDDALDRPRGTPARPAERVEVDLPFLKLFGLPAHVAEWRPMRTLVELEKDPVADVAVLELLQPASNGLESGSVGLVPPPERTPVSTFGFPTGTPNGTIADGELLTEDTGGWRQVRSLGDYGYFVEPGFSGAPLFDARGRSLLGMMVAADRDSERRLAFAIPSHTLAQVWPPLVKPYKGLYAFEERDASLFFGRDRVIDELHDAIARSPVLTVVGPSGSGKSSVVMAGLAPRLRETGIWEIERCRPGYRPLYALARAVTSLLLPESAPETERNTKAEELERRLRTDPEFLLERVKAVPEVHRGVERVLLVIDQFEELLTLDDRREPATGATAATDAAASAVSQRQQEFICVLERLAVQTTHPAPLIHVVATLRADFMGAALQLPGLSSILETDVKLGPMAPSELATAIERPAAQFGVTFESGLVPEIVARMGAIPGALPLMQFALDRLWRSQDGRVLTMAAYRAIGEVRGALADYADTTFSRLEPDDCERAKRVFIQLVRFPAQPSAGVDSANGTLSAASERASGDWHVVTRAIADRSQIGEHDWPVVEKLTSARLVTTGRDPDTNAETVELAHEELIRSWPRLQGWINEAQAELWLVQQLRDAAARWQRLNQHPDLLWRGPDLVRLQHHRRAIDATLPLSSTQRAFAEASVRHAERVRRRKRLVTGLGVFFTVAVTGLSLLLGRQNYLEWVERRAWGELVNLNTGAQYKLFNRIATVGRQVESNAALTDVDLGRQVRSVSRSHLNMARSRHVMDLRSTFGTTLNGRPLLYSKEAGFEEGDVFVLGGQTPLQFRAYDYEWYEWLPFAERIRPAQKPACGWGILIYESGNGANYRVLVEAEVGVQVRDGEVALVPHADAQAVISLYRVVGDPKIRFLPGPDEARAGVAVRRSDGVRYSDAIRYYHMKYGQQVAGWGFRGAAVRVNRGPHGVDAEWRVTAYDIGRVELPPGEQVVAGYSDRATEARHAFQGTMFMSFVVGESRLQVVPFVEIADRSHCAS